MFLAVMYVAYCAGVHMSSIYYVEILNEDDELDIRYNKLLEKHINEENWSELKSIVNSKIQFSETSLEVGEKRLKEFGFIDTVMTRFELKGSEK